MYSTSEKIEIMKSAGYDKTSANKAINIGVYFFDTLEELREFDESARYDIGTIDGREVYFINTATID